MFKLKVLRSDKGGEYLSYRFKEFLLENGIKHELTVVYTPQQNGVAERMNRTLLNLVPSMLHHHNIPKKFWAEALSTAVNVRNRVTSRALPQNVTPHHLWHGSKPDLSHMRVFGSKCWYVTPSIMLKKLDPRSQEAMMVGYSKQNKGYKLWDEKINRFVVSRDVRFAESTSFFHSENVLKHTKSDQIIADFSHSSNSDESESEEMNNEVQQSDEVSAEARIEMQNNAAEVQPAQPEVHQSATDEPRRSTRVSKKTWRMVEN